MKKQITIKDFTDNPKTRKSAEQIYNQWLKNKDKPIEKEPTEQEKLNAQLLKSNLEFQKALIEQKKVNANLSLQIQALQKKEGNK